jgi:hypothetical protein
MLARRLSDQVGIRVETEAVSRSGRWNSGGVAWWCDGQVRRTARMVLRAGYAGKLNAFGNWCHRRLPLAAIVQQLCDLASLVTEVIRIIHRTLNLTSPGRPASVICG